MATQPKTLTELESVVMDCIWDMPEATVRQVQQQLQSTRPLAYNTVLTVMRILRDKGFLASQRDGRKDIYRPRVSRRQAARRSVRDLLDRVFAGSAEALITQLLESEELTAEQIQAIRCEVDKRLHAEAQAPANQGERS